MYNITKGQLITIWVFGVFLWVVTFFCGLYSYSSIFDKIWLFLFLVIPFIVVFHTIGWRNCQKRSLKHREREKARERERERARIREGARIREAVRIRLSSARDFF